MDQVLAENMSRPEQTAWRRCRKLFRLSPLDLLPEGVSVDIPKARKPIQHAVLGQITNTNWTDEFADSFNKVICLPVFAHRPNVLRYAIASARHHRLGAKGDGPPRSLLENGRDERYRKLFRIELKPVSPEEIAVYEKSVGKLVPCTESERDWTLT